MSAKLRPAILSLATIKSPSQEEKTTSRVDSLPNCDFHSVKLRWLVCTGALLPDDLLAGTSCTHDDANVRAHTQHDSLQHSTITAGGSDRA